LILSFFSLLSISSLFCSSQADFCTVSAHCPYFVAHSRQASQDIAMMMLPETLMRKLADLAFFLQQYEFAFNTYHAVKKECNEKNARLLAATQVCFLSASWFYRRF
jgi:hypothetical protein